MSLLKITAKTERCSRGAHRKKVVKDYRKISSQIHTLMHKVPQVFNLNSLWQGKAQSGHPSLICIDF